MNAAQIRIGAVVAALTVLLGCVTSLSNNKHITSFVFTAEANESLGEDVSGTVDGTAITALLPAGTDVTSLVPTIEIPAGAAIFPESGMVQDFTESVLYTVMAEDGTTQSYTVSVTVGASSQNDIISFIFARDENAGIAADVVGDINGTAITATVPAGTDITALVPTIETSYGASVLPESGVAQDFTEVVSYTVTAENGSTREYSVAVAVAPSGDNYIASFVFETVLNPILSADAMGVIDGTSIAVTVPSGVAVTALAPTIEVSPGASLSPAAGVARDFTETVTYTVTAENGSTREYEAIVSAAPFEFPITSFVFTTADNPELGEQIDGSIGESAISLAIDVATDLTALVPSIEAGPGSTLSPLSGVAQDFSSPVTYTVTGADSSTHDYVVTVGLLDQDNLLGTCCEFTAAFPDLYQQTVTAGRDGYLFSIVVEPHSPYGDGVVRFSLYPGTATEVTTPIFTEDIDTYTSDGSVVVWDISSLRFEVLAGTAFTFGLQSVTEGSGASFADDQANQYGEGELFINGAAFDPPRDLAFRTYVSG